MQLGEGRMKFKTEDKVIVVGSTWTFVDFFEQYNDMKVEDKK